MLLAEGRIPVPIVVRGKTFSHSKKTKNLGRAYCSVFFNDPAPSPGNVADSTTISSPMCDYNLQFRQYSGVGINNAAESTYHQLEPSLQRRVRCTPDDAVFLEHFVDPPQKALQRCACLREVH